MNTDYETPPNQSIAVNIRMLVQPCAQPLTSRSSQRGQGASRHFQDPPVYTLKIQY